MGTIKLGTRPKTFKQTVSVPLHEGGEGTIQVTFVYRTRTEYGDFIDALLKDAGVPLAGSSEADVIFSLGLVFSNARDKNAEYLMQIMSGWNLDVEFDLQAVQQLCDELPGAAKAIMTRYVAAITEGRLGN